MSAEIFVETNVDNSNCRANKSQHMDVVNPNIDVIMDLRGKKEMVMLWLCPKRGLSDRVSNTIIVTNLIYQMYIKQALCGTSSVFVAIELTQLSFPISIVLLELPFNIHLYY